jgi:hypothetical protein
MKIATLQKRIYLNLTLSLVILSAFASSYFFVNARHSNIIKQSNDFKAEAEQIGQKIVDIKKKEEDLKKYRILWNKLPDSKKKLDGVRAEEFQALLDNLAKTHMLKVVNIAIPLPEPLPLGDADKSSLNLFSTEVTITLNAHSDNEVFNFIEDLDNKITGFLLFKSIEIKKSREYKEEDFIKIANSIPDFVPIFNVVIKFFWYSYRDKEVANIPNTSQERPQNKTPPKAD